MVDCEFAERCANEDSECDFCCYNPEACTQNLFEPKEGCFDLTDEEQDRMQS
jgi:hypothetical protein